MAWTGGCLCGACRYEFEGPVDDVAHCHCGMCRRASGGTVNTWVTVRKTRFRWLSGSPRVYRSSKRAQRFFCPSCGAQMVFAFDHADYLDVTVATLDRAQEVTPTRHVWYESRLPWLHLDEYLPAEQRESDPLGPHAADRDDV